MITQDGPAGESITSPEEQQQQKNLLLNPAAPVFRQSLPDKSRGLSEGSLSEQEASPDITGDVLQGHLSNGDVHVANGPGSNFMVSVAGSPIHREGSPSAVGSAEVTGIIGTPLTGPQSPMMVAGVSHQHQDNFQAISGSGFRQTQQPAAMNSPPQVAKISGNEICGDSIPSKPQSVNDGDGDASLDPSAANSEDDEMVWDGIEKEYPEEQLQAIRRQVEYYFSAENLPNDKYLNQNMDKDKYVSLGTIAAFNKMRNLVKDGIGQLIQAIKTSSVLELNEKKTRVRVTQTRKTLTLRDLPPRATDEDVKNVLKNHDCPVAIHIENIIVQNNVSNWYVSFESEAHCLDAFYKLLGAKAQLNGYTIRCCIKSSGTHAASGYFPSQEENHQRKNTQQQTQPQQGTVAPAPTQQQQQQQPQQAPISPQTPQSPAQLIQHQYGAMPIHHTSFMATGQGLYYPQSAHPQSMYMNPYVPQMITQGWPGAPGLDPGLIMQNNGLQPQHIRTPLARPHVVQGGGSQHRFPKPPRNNRQNNVERSVSERSNDRPSQVTVSGAPARSSPRNGENNGNNLVPQNAFVQRRPEEVTAVIPQPQATQHQYITPLVTQTQQQQHASNSAVVTPTTAIMNSGGLDPVAVVTGQHYHSQQHHQHQQQQLIVQGGLGGNAANSGPHTQTSNPPPMGHHQTHHAHPHHHHQPPPPLPHHHQQQPHNHHQHHHQHQPPPAHHHHQQQQQPPSQPVSTQHPHSNQHHHQQHQNHHHHPHHHHQPPPPHHVSVNQHHTQQPPPQPPAHPHQQTGQNATHHPHHPHGLMPPHHHNQMPPPPAAPQHHHHHHQPQNAPQGGRNDTRRPRRKREENNPRSNRQNERNQSNRANFSSQVPPVSDNFTMEANSFPPLPGVTNSVTSAENMFENKMADVVRGRSRMPQGGPSASSSVSSSVRATSTTPSPEATPAPNAVPVVPNTQLINASLSASGNPTSNHQQSMTAPVIVDSRAMESSEPMLEDRVHASSQDEELDKVSQEVRVLDLQGVSDIVPLPQGAPKVPITNIVNSTQRPMESSGRSNISQVAPSVRSQNQTPAKQINSPICNVAPAETPGFKLSYAQIAAQKNREAAGNVAINAIDVPQVNVVTTNIVQTVQVGSPTTTHVPSTGSGTTKSAMSGNGFRDQQPAQPQNARIAPRAAKDGSPRVEGPINSRPMNGRRNSKENSRVVPGKFDRRKDGRAK